MLIRKNSKKNSSYQINPKHLKYFMKLQKESINNHLVRQSKLLKRKITKLLKTTRLSSKLHHRKRARNRGQMTLKIDTETYL
jgi:DNA/RNA endonuclease YhcR with UshA esterase domain